MATNDELKLEEYEIEAWIIRLGSMPKEVIEWCDRSEDYSTCRFLILKLEDGNYATVEESGCSCYSSSEANIEIFSTKAEARDRFDKWCRLRDESENQCVCGKHRYSKKRNTR